MLNGCAHVVANFEEDRSTPSDHPSSPALLTVCGLHHVVSLAAETAGESNGEEQEHAEEVYIVDQNFRCLAMGKATPERCSSLIPVFVKVLARCERDLVVSVETS